MSIDEGQVPPPFPPQEAPLPQATGNDDRTMGLLCHLLPLVVGFVGPLIIWLLKKDESPFVDDQGKEALNFQLSVLIVAVGLSATCVGLVLVPVVAVYAIVYCVIAGVAANRGEAFRYPLTIRMIK